MWSNTDPRDRHRNPYRGSDAANPAHRTNVQNFINKLEGYDGKITILRDQNNRVYILSRLAWHLSPAHLAYLISFLSGLLKGKLLARPGLYFGDVAWHPRWGPEPAPQEVEPLPEEALESPVPPQSVGWQQIRAVMMEHCLFDETEDALICQCLKEFPDKDKFNKHVRARVKELFNG